MVKEGQEIIKKLKKETVIKEDPENWCLQTDAREQNEERLGRQGDI